MRCVCCNNRLTYSESKHKAPDGSFSDTCVECRSSMVDQSVTFKDAQFKDLTSRWWIDGGLPKTRTEE